MNNTIVVESAKLVDRLYSNHLTVWYTLFAIQGADKIPNRGSIEIGAHGGKILFQTLYDDHIQSLEIERTIAALAKTSACRAYMRENFRITQNYCIENNISMFQDQSWYQFARILVNCISHDMIFDLSTVNKNRLPAVFNGISIDTDMDGKHLNELFTAQIFLELGDAILLFVINNLEK